MLPRTWIFLNQEVKVTVGVQLSNNASQNGGQFLYNALISSFSAKSKCSLKINAFMIFNILNRMVQAIWKYNQYNHYSVHPLLFSIKLILIPKSASTVYTVPLGGLSIQPAHCWLPHGFLFLFHQGCKMSSYSPHESQFFSWNNTENFIYIMIP